MNVHKGVADLVVALDAGLGPVNYGTHTNNSRGQPNPARAAAQCITDIYTIPLPDADAPVSAVTMSAAR